MNYQVIILIVHFRANLLKLFLSDFRSILHVVCCAACIFSPFSMASPGAPDAGQVLKQIERQIKKIQPQQIDPEPEKEPIIEPKILSEGEVEFFIKKIVLTGNQLITTEEIYVLFNPLLNRKVTIDELKLSIDEVAFLYQEKGLVGRASLRKQDITNGTVSIIIREGIFGGAKLLIDPNIDYLVDPEIIKNYIEYNLPVGTPVDTFKLERATLIASDLAGVMVNQSLQAGENPGETDAGVRMINEPWLINAIKYDNYGSKATGYHQTLISSSLLSPRSVGDRFDTMILRTSGVTYGSFGYTTPVGYSGLNFGVNFSLMSYDVVNGEAESLDLSGLSRTISFDASYPLIRSRINNLNLTSSLDIKQLVNRSSFGNESDYKVKTFNIGANYQDLTGGLMGGEFYGTINYGLGHNDYGDSPVTFKDGKKNENTDGSHTIISSAMNFTQFINDKNSVTFEFSGQYGNKNLDSSQKFFLGGERTVRAYPTSEVGGTHGLLFKVDYDYILTNEITIATFYDHGYVKQYKKDVNPSTNQTLTLAGNTNDVTLRGYGFSLEYLGPLNTSFKVTWSDRIGSNPNRTSSNIDSSNGETARPMTWFSSSINYYF